MSDNHDYGPIQSYEVAWLNRPPEIVQGHQVIIESSGFMARPDQARIMIHGEFDGHWRLMLMAPEHEVISVKNVTEQLAALEQLAAADEQVPRED